jgi:anti-sigma factor RsiW
MMSQCQQSEKLGAYHDGELSAAARQELERHLALCPQCQAELADLRRLSASLAAMPVPRVPSEALARMHRQVDQLASRGIFRLGEVGAAIAAAVLIACTVALSRQNSVSAAPLPAPAWEVQAAYGPTVDLASGESETMLVGWTVQDLSGGGENE